MTGLELDNDGHWLECSVPTENFAEQVVADKMQALVNQNRMFRDLSDEGRIIIKWTPMT